jgi:Arc/MetJ-type ribon-helix-helix transcriptional regulator
MTIHLPDELRDSIRAEVLKGYFATEDDAVTAIVREHFRRKATEAVTTAAPAASETEAVRARKPVWERIQELTADIPDQEWDKLPADLSEQHDHYIYGTPKRPTA